MTVYTVGHSNRGLRQFIDLLKAHGVKQVVDVRSIPRSRSNPQFNRETLAKSLRNRGIGYRHMKRLGGFRHARKDSPNLGWENLSFRGYADYMSTPAFDAAKKDLEKAAAKKTTAIMCAEALPWRCHRSLIADALIKDRVKVLDITGPRAARAHRLTPFLRVRRGRIVYPKI